MDTNEDNLRCGLCSKVFLLKDENAWKGHIKKCRYDLLVNLTDDEKKFVGSWESDFYIDNECLITEIIKIAVDGTFTVKIVQKQARMRIMEFGLYRYEPLYVYDTIVQKYQKGGGKWKLYYLDEEGVQIELNGRIRCKEICFCENCKIEGSKLSDYLTNWKKDMNLVEWEENYKNRNQKCCYLCFDEGHLRKDCPSIKCFECGEKNHKKKNCPKLLENLQETSQAKKAFKSEIVYKEKK
jgi:hypothetical protein